MRARHTGHLFTRAAHNWHMLKCEHGTTRQSRLFTKHTQHGSGARGCSGAVLETALPGFGGMWHATSGPCDDAARWLSSSRRRRRRSRRTYHRCTANRLYATAQAHVTSAATRGFRAHGARCRKVAFAACSVGAASGGCKLCAIQASIKQLHDPRSAKTPHTEEYTSVRRVLTVALRDKLAMLSAAGDFWRLRWGANSVAGYMPLRHVENDVEEARQMSSRNFDDKPRSQRGRAWACPSLRPRSVAVCVQPSRRR